MCLSSVSSLSRSQRKCPSISFETCGKAGTCERHGARLALYGLAAGIYKLQPWKWKSSQNVQSLPAVAVTPNTHDQYEVRAWQNGPRHSARRERLETRLGLRLHPPHEQRILLKLLTGHAGIKDVACKRLTVLEALAAGI